MSALETLLRQKANCLPRLGGAALAAIVAMGAAMTNAGEASAKQQPRPVVALICDADLQLCRAVVRALADTAPGRIYRINPQPIPEAAVTLRLTATSEDVSLSWANGVDARLPKADLSDDDMARQLVALADPDLRKTLNLNAEDSK